MPLQKATQAVISPNICTTDTTQTITGTKKFTSNIEGPTSILSATGDAFTITNTGSGASFRVNDNTGDTTPFVITDTGDVAIGAATALAKLYVNGNAQIASNLVVTGVINAPNINDAFFQGVSSGSITTQIMQGVTDGSVPVITAYIGEFLEEETAPTIASNITLDAITFQLPAGVWAIQGQARFNTSATAFSASTTSLSLSNQPTQLQPSKMGTLFLHAATITAAPAYTLLTPTIPVIAPAQTNYYLVIKTPIFTGTVTCTAIIRATRIR